MTEANHMSKNRYKVYFYNHETQRWNYKGTITAPSHTEAIHKMYSFQHSFKKSRLKPEFKTIKTPQVGDGKDIRHWETTPSPNIDTEFWKIVK